MTAPTADTARITVVLENLIKTRKVFTAYHVTLILRKCGFIANHSDVRQVIRGYDFASADYKVELAKNSALTTPPNIYFHISTTAQEVEALEKELADAIPRGTIHDTPKVATPIVGGPVLNLSKKVVAKVPDPKAPVPTPKKVAGNVAINVGEVLDVKADYRGRYAIPARIVRTLFKSGDVVGVHHDTTNKVTVFEVSKPANRANYVTLLTVDSYGNIRVKQDHLSHANGKVAVEYVTSHNQLQLREA